jgi:hypothetical protein
MYRIISQVTVQLCKRKRVWELEGEMTKAWIVLKWSSVRGIVVNFCDVQEKPTERGRCVRGSSQPLAVQHVVSGYALENTTKKSFLVILKILSDRNVLLWK